MVSAPCLLKLNRQDLPVHTHTLTVHLSTEIYIKIIWGGGGGAGSVKGEGGGVVTLLAVVAFESDGSSMAVNQMGLLRL